MEKCPECGKDYKKLGNHWWHKKSHRPSLTDRQHEVTKGLMMGDGYVTRHGKNPGLSVEMITPKYLEHLDNVFGVMSTGIRLKRTAEEAAMRNRKSGFSPNAKKDNYSDQYEWTTRKHPGFDKYLKWYSSGSKVFPKDLKLSPTALKTWYVCDGYYDKQRGMISIAINNEIENIEKIKSYFSNCGIPEPSLSTHKIRFGVSETKILFSYMGDSPPPGFDYKWPN